MAVDLVTASVVVLAVLFGLWVIWFALPWLIDREGEFDESVDAYGIDRRVEQEVDR
ncbi:hypothetical protein [Nocardia sp. R7R-8]|uniref:hypothetical protein n=1 Tax=Nocardia sp. R7R-8 TaxID=3459304 RepID=UPI00403D5D29